MIFSKETHLLRQQLQRLTGENAMLCNQCRKCTLSCPVGPSMRMKPHELMRAIQLGLAEEIYWSGTIWLCVSCETCSARCPQNIHVLGLINGLRQMAENVEFYNPYPGIASMYRIFESLLKRFGRIHELSLYALTRLVTLTPFQDLDLAYLLITRGKLRLRPERSQGMKQLERILSRISEKEE